MSERYETREAVARAIYEDRNGLHCQPWAKVSGQRREDYTSHATAALKALSPGSRFTVEGVECVVVRADPTEAMMAAGLKEGDILGELVDWRGPDTATREDIARVYRAMLRACEEKGDG